MPERREDQSGLGGFAAAMRKAQPYIDASWQLVASVGLGTALGWWLDRKFDTAPWLLVAGAVLGMAAGLYSFFRIILVLAAKEPPSSFEIRPYEEARTKSRFERKERASPEQRQGSDGEEHRENEDADRER